MYQSYHDHRTKSSIIKLAAAFNAGDHTGMIVFHESLCKICDIVMIYSIHMFIGYYLKINGSSYFYIFLAKYRFDSPSAIAIFTLLGSACVKTLSTHNPNSCEMRESAADPPIYPGSQRKCSPGHLVSETNGVTIELLKLIHSNFVSYQNLSNIRRDAIGCRWNWRYSISHPAVELST